MADVTRHFHPVLAARDLGSSPLAFRLAGKGWVAFRDRSGRPAALADRCPHRFAPLSQGRVRPDGRLACPYHGWHFDGSGEARSPAQPSLKNCRVESLQVIERHGALWVAAPETPASAMPALESPGYQLAGAFTWRFEAPLHVVLDNFSENEHTPYVHGFLGWTERGGRELEFSAKNFEDRTEVSYAAPQRPSIWLPALRIRRGDWFHNQWVTRFSPVHSIYEMYWSDPRSGARRPVTARIPIFFVPESESVTNLFTFVYVRLEDPRLRPLLPLIKRIGLHIARNEVRDDAGFIRHIAATPRSFRGMRLGKFDKPLIHNHRLLEEIYYGRAPTDQTGRMASPTRGGRPSR